MPMSVVAGVARQGGPYIHTMGVCDVSGEKGGDGPGKHEVLMLYTSSLIPLLVEAGLITGGGRPDESLRNTP